MDRHTKNIITRENCKKDLKDLIKSDISFDACMLVIVLLIHIPLLCISIYILTFSLIIGIPMFLGSLLMPTYYIYELTSDIIRMRLVVHDGFSIVKDRVQVLSKGEVQNRQTVNVIYFAEYGRYPANNMTFTLSSVGDEFYLVVIHTKKKEATFAYHTNYYECSELD